MKKAQYFALIKEITAHLRNHGIEYGKVYSEPRKSFGYRTKLYLCRHIAAKVINEKFGSQVTATPYFGGMHKLMHVKITPNKFVK